MVLSVCEHSQDQFKMLGNGIECKIATSNANQQVRKATQWNRNTNPCKIQTVHNNGCNVINQSHYSTSNVNQ